MNNVAYSITVSVGIALRRPGSSSETFSTVAVELLEAADAAMYTAKKSGRNQVHASFN